MKLRRSAKIVILDANGQALMLRRSAGHPRSAHRPDLPGGIVETGETIEEGLIREIFEEVGLTISLSSLQLIYTFTRSFLGISVNRLLYATRLDVVEPPITISWEHDQYSWQPIDHLNGLELPYQEGIAYANKHDLWSAV